MGRTFVPAMLLRGADIAQVEDALNTFYRTRPAEYRVELVEEEDNASYAEFISHFAAKGSMLLDFGTGSWRLPLSLSRHGFDVTGVDIFSEDDLVRFSSKLEGSGAKLLTYDGKTLPFPDQSFDVVSSRNVFEHIINVDDVLNELDRVLKPGGLFILHGPNWSGPNIPIRAILSLLRSGRRYWQYECILDAIVGLFRSFVWYMRVRFSSSPHFLLIYPRMKNGTIFFEKSDDDAVHLNQPYSFYSWFVKKGYSVVRYNRQEGSCFLTKLFNSAFPSFATSNRMVFRK